MHDPPRVLIVAPDEANCDILASLLSACGYDLYQTVDGEQALKVARAQTPDLILLDATMPQINGIDVCRNVRTDVTLSFMSIVLIKAKAGINDVNAELNASADDCLTEPLCQAAVVARVRSALRLKALEDRAAAQASALSALNDSIEQLVTEQLCEIERVGRLKRFLPPQIAQLVVSAGHERMLESHRCDVTLLSCDLRGFSAFSELAEPEEVILVLSEYHSSLGKLVNKYKGTVDSFTGDGLLVVFNDPVPCPDPSLHAVQMAVEMREELGALSAKWRQSGHDIGFGIGIAHGYATLGIIGYESRLQYSVMGKVVNLAARLCDKAQSGEILIDINVFSAVEKSVDVDIMKDLVLKGFTRPVKAFNVRHLRLQEGEAPGPPAH